MFCLGWRFWSSQIQKLRLEAEELGCALEREIRWRSARVAAVHRCDRDDHAVTDLLPREGVEEPLVVVTILLTFLFSVFASFRAIGPFGP